MNLYLDGVPFTPETGKAYRNINGRTYRCVVGPDGDEYQTGCAWFENGTGLYFKAMHCMRYPDGCIDWGYSVHWQYIGEGAEA